MSGQDGVRTGTAGQAVPRRETTRRQPTGRAAAAGAASSRGRGASVGPEQAWADLRDAVHTRRRDQEAAGRGAPRPRLTVPFRDDEVPGLLAALAAADERAERVRVLLAGHGLGGDNLPGLCGSLDEAGEPVVALGRVEPCVMDRLLVILRRAA